MNSSLVSAVSPVKKRACVQCTNAKAKCTPASDTVCQRCTRLNKDCVYLEVVEKRRKQRETRRVEALEGKVDGLVAQLATLAEQNAALMSRPTRQIPTPSEAQSDSPVHDPGLVSQRPGRLSNEDRFSHPARDLIDPIGNGFVSFDQAIALVDEFREKNVPQFPFVVVPDGVAVLTLRRDWPFLFSAIISVMLYSHPETQRRLGESLQSQFITRAVMRSEKSLDILQGLLVYLAWYHYFMPPNEQKMYILMEMAIDQLYSLELNKSTRETSLGHSNVPSQTPSKTDHTLAEKRTLLGTYWTSLNVAKALRNPGSMRYTRYMDQCCEQLTSAAEHPTDIWIKPFVQLQVLTCRVDETFCYYDIGSSQIVGGTSVQVASRGFLLELDSIRQLLPDNLPSPTFFILEAYFLEAWINEPALHDDFWNETPASLHVPLVQGLSASRATRMNMTTRIQTSNKSFIHRFLDIPNDELLHLAFSSFSRLCYILISQVKVAFALLEASKQQANVFSSVSSSGLPISSPLQVILDEVDFVNDCAALYEKFKTACNDEYTLGQDRECMVHFACVVKGMKSGYEHQLKTIVDLHQNQEGTSAYSQMLLDNNSVGQFADLSTMESSYGESSGMGLNQGIIFSGPYDGWVFDETRWDAAMDHFILPI